MGQVIHLRKSPKQPLRNQEKYKVSIRITDSRNPEETRWIMQRIIQNASGFRANKGFTDKRAIKQFWHNFTVSNKNINEFIRESKNFVLRGLAEIEISGRPIEVLRQVNAK